MLGFMTEPQFSGNDGGNSYPPPGPHEGYGQPGPQYSAPPGAYPPPPPPGHYPPPGGGYPAGYTDPAAPWGRHPVTGEPFSDKSKVVAGLLQLLGLFGLVGIGRIYLGDTKLGVIQLVVGLLTCGIGAIIWGIIDAVLILTDKVRDPQDRPLRDGT
jgi:TM2 domain-containing membrane protein YozV